MHYYLPRGTLSPAKAKRSTQRQRNMLSAFCHFVYCRVVLRFVERCWVEFDRWRSKLERAELKNPLFKDGASEFRMVFPMEWNLKLRWLLNMTLRTLELIWVMQLTTESRVWLRTPNSVSILIRYPRRNHYCTWLIIYFSVWVYSEFHLIVVIRLSVDHNRLKLLRNLHVYRYWW